MKPGNHARVIFNKENEEVIIGLIDDGEQYDILISILDNFQFMQSVYCAIKPDPLYVAICKKIAVEVGEPVKTHSNVACQPTYLHKHIEHVQEIQEDPKWLRVH